MNHHLIVTQISFWEGKVAKKAEAEKYGLLPIAIPPPPFANYYSFAVVKSFQ